QRHAHRRRVGRQRAGQRLVGALPVVVGRPPQPGPVRPGPRRGARRGTQRRRRVVRAAIAYLRPLRLPVAPEWLAGARRRGPQAWRVRYTAGYATVPGAVQEACALWTAELAYATSRDPALASQSAPSLSAQTWQKPDAGPPPRVQALLAPFRKRGV